MSARTNAALRWQWAPFDQLSGREVHDVLALRQRVFVVEQNCAYQDADGRDIAARHLLYWSAAIDAPRSLLGYARVFEAGVRYAEVSIGRIVSAPEVRGTGVGRLVVTEAMRRCAEHWPDQPIRIAAQRRLEKFYTEFGFAVSGEPYLEDGIEHIDMLLHPAGR